MGILQAMILEWIAISFAKQSLRQRDILFWSDTVVKLIHRKKRCIRNHSLLVGKVAWRNYLIGC